MYTLLEEKKSSSSKVYVAQRAAFLYLLVVFFFFLSPFQQSSPGEGKFTGSSNLLKTSKRTSDFFQATWWDKESWCEQKEFGPDTTGDFFKVLSYVKLNTFYI